MGVRVVIKKEGITYMASDVSLDVNSKNINEYHSYMMTLKNGIILGFREHNPISDLLTSHLEWFNTDQDTLVDKEFIVNKIVNPLLQLAYKKKYITEDIELKNAIYIITQDKGFQILNNGCVLEFSEFVSGDNEEIVAFTTYMNYDDQQDAEMLIDTIFKALRKNLTYISHQYVIINNKTYESKLVEVDPLCL